MTSADHTAPPGPFTSADAVAVERQLGRPPRGVRGVAHRCPCGNPDVVRTAPRLPDGTPFPTLYYLTCPRAASAIGTLEADGVMRTMQARLAEDPELRAVYERAHASYRAERDDLARADGVDPLPATTQTAGGMPERVKCLHALVAHELAAPGGNPFGREALDALPDWWAEGPCVHADPDDAPPSDPQAGTPTATPTDHPTGHPTDHPTGHRTDHPTEDRT
ncbi:hypothetical protein CLV63_10513 [Murinocardiopsis flavida]|uniref:DUF501 domain-containing protein n=1 Tax=Murinocardiopsis flavida TaxID=645275 RepID=A0A2P8DM99_9ACTN|nr:DUF501 domain-containing protein [Murinocardiopsis flavida]PSK98342.1 hypothetical protein CLV63_10513 [Murinocardiopsis flavida]